MKHAARVGCRDPACDLLREGARIFFGERAVPLEQIVQRRTFDQLAHQERPSVDHTVIEHLDDVPVADARRSLRFALEAFYLLFVTGHVCSQKAHDDVAVKLVVERSVNIRGSATADPLAQVEART